LPFEDLRQWIAALDRAGQLQRIQTEVDPILEVAEITDRISKMHMRGQPPSGVQLGEARQPGGPALLFQNIEHHPGS
jgi:4-hydroxy-3-polyprenylbenzoate decarboxylase